MSMKVKKKRTKRYTGKDAATTTPAQPVVHRIKAVDRAPLAQWWFEKKAVVKPIATVAGIAAVVIWLIVELVRVAA